MMVIAATTRSTSDGRNVFMLGPWGGRGGPRSGREKPTLGASTGGLSNTTLCGCCRRLMSRERAAGEERETGDGGREVRILKFLGAS